MNGEDGAEGTADELEEVDYNSRNAQVAEGGGVLPG
jgi:hypothetical protein